MADACEFQLVRRLGAGGMADVYLARMTVRGQRPELVALNEALDALATVDPRKAQVVELRFFGGFTNDEIAEFLQVSAITVMRDWSTARAWLHRAIRENDEDR